MDNDDLKARLRAYLKSSVDLVLRQDDLNGDEKADRPRRLHRSANPKTWQMW
jgi:hypothetical protein